MTIKNAIPRKQRIYFIRPSRHHIFGTDFERRDQMTDDEAVARFDEVWTKSIYPALEIAEHIEHTEAMSLIQRHAHVYCVAEGNNHYRFKLLNTVFIAQVSEPALEHNQLWAVAAQNFDTRTVYATFEQQSERDDWTKLATRLKKTPEDLARLVLTAYLRTFDDA